MAALKGDCGVACKSDRRSCWHVHAKILRRFQSGKFLLENRHGYVRAAIPADIIFSNDEEREYSDYNLKADALELSAMYERELLRAKMKENR